jgi:hypothetical protein
MVNNFVYLGSCITEDNNKQEEIQRRLKLANKAYYSFYAIMKSCDIHKKTKIRLYKTLIRTVLTYGCENWKLTKKSEDDINSFERKILWRIFGTVNENGQWRSRYNKELHQLYKDLDLVTFVKLKVYNGLDTFSDYPWNPYPKESPWSNVHRQTTSWKAQEKTGGCGKGRCCQFTQMQTKSETDRPK